MKTAKNIIIAATLGLVAACPAQTFTFHTVLASSSTANDALDAATVADHLGTHNYNGSVGEMGLVFSDQIPFAGIDGTPTGSFRRDAGDQFAGQFGMVSYCVDSDAPFSGTNGVATVTLTAYTVAAAESRYRSEVPYYLPGALKRAAYLLETFAPATHADGNNAAAAMQAAVWESLYDNTVSVTEGAGNYYLRTSYGTTTAKATAVDIRDRANSMLNQAAAGDWGGASYNPGDRVLVWMDPVNANRFQSVIALRAPSVPVTAVPEPAAPALLALGVMAMAMRRRR